MEWYLELYQDKSTTENFIEVGFILSHIKNVVKVDMNMPPKKTKTNFTVNTVSVLNIN